MNNLKNKMTVEKVIYIMVTDKENRLLFTDTVGSADSALRALAISYYSLLNPFKSIAKVNLTKTEYDFTEKEALKLKEMIFRRGDEVIGITKGLSVNLKLWQFIKVLNNNKEFKIILGDIDVLSE